VAEKKSIKVRINKALAQAKAKKRLMIIEMPEEMETTPHWLLWLVLLSLIGFGISAGWQLFAVGSNLQAYLPFL